MLLKAKITFLVFFVISGLFLSTSYAFEHSSAKPKVVLLGVDGLTEGVINKLINQNELKNIQYLMNHGSYGRIASIEPTYSPCLWTSMVTGKYRQQHGITGFVKENKDGKIITINSSHRKVKALWNIFSERDMTVGTIGYFTTWPVEEVNGFMISDHSIFPIKKGYYPAKTKDIMKEILAPYISFDINRLNKFAKMPFEEKMRYFTPLMLKYLDELGAELIDGYRQLKGKHIVLEQYQDFFENNPIIAQSVYRGLFVDNIKFKYAKRLYNSDLDFFALYLKGPDVISHHTWGYYEPGPNVPVAGINTFKDVIPNYYKFIDRVLGYFLANAGTDTVIILVSDHGFEKSQARPIYKINKMLNTLGYLDYGPDGKIKRDKIYDKFTSLWQDRRGRKLLVNLENMFPNRDPRQDEKKMERIVAELASIEVGQIKYFERLNFFPRKSGPGKYIIQALISEGLEQSVNEYFSSPARVEGTISINRRAYLLKDYFGLSEVLGQHSTDSGVVYFMGPMIKAKNHIKEFGILDMTPAILKIFDLPTGADMASDIPVDIFKPEFLMRHPPSHIKSYDEIKKPLSRTAPEESPVDHIMKKQLRSLGYIQ